LPVAILHDEAGLRLFDCPRRGEAAGPCGVLFALLVETAKYSGKPFSFIGIRINFV
jgi:hypothetical protein